MSSKATKNRSTKRLKDQHDIRMNLAAQRVSTSYCMVILPATSIALSASFFTKPMSTWFNLAIIFNAALTWPAYNFLQSTAYSAGRILLSTWIAAYLSLCYIVPFLHKRAKRPSKSTAYRSSSWSGWALQSSSSLARLQLPRFLVLWSVTVLFFYAFLFSPFGFFYWVLQGWLLLA